MPKKEICINTGVEVSIDKVFNFSTPEQVYDKLVKISEDSVKPFIEKFGEPSRLLFKTKKYIDTVSIQIHFIRMETDEEYEERRKKLKEKYLGERAKKNGAVIEIKRRKKHKSLRDLVGIKE